MLRPVAVAWYAVMAVLFLFNEQALACPSFLPLLTVSITSECTRLHHCPARSSCGGNIAIYIILTVIKAAKKLKPVLFYNKYLRLTDL